ncbi:LytR/AlgR family response regulator transcription factor [Lachnobacterium bovis]|uniref:LytTr DNA-binding domain-containing protein n=1 Tax=Lachnobacterium bovis DSM 14045 TaxID=1122142 RepID=A0A1H3KG45_9FIRM|nr:LytTR family DNA-binding domain-containing protein [Lachnobacterium bovis]SDY51009.1 LytTr DNA-binding domain-containing protein [Lachnobacterium bovis DSM 14045]
MLKKDEKQASIFDKNTRDFLTNIKIEDIIYCESCGHKLILHTIHKDIHMYAKLNDIEEYLATDMFFRIHKSYLVNKRFIQGIDKNIIILSNGIRLNISRSTSKEIHEKCLLAALKKNMSHDRTFTVAEN